MAKKTEPLDVNVGEVVDYLRLNGGFAPALRAVVERKLAIAAARKAGLKVSDKELQAVADNWRITTGLHRAEDTTEWLQNNGLTLEALELYLEGNFLISKFKDKLAAKADKASFVGSVEIQETLRDMIFADWLVKALE